MPRSKVARTNHSYGLYILFIDCHFAIGQAARKPVQGANLLCDCTVLYQNLWNLTRGGF